MWQKRRIHTTVRIKATNVTSQTWANQQALSGNIVILVMVSWMYNNAKDVKTEIDNTLRVSAPLR
ncbi:MAG: hypothetical protein C5S47_08015 [Candidatus Methanogasteraceae archaeon]|nr:MAG: hypothetical protein C5S47_08015 [ANME-2 cluster archaeon]